MESDADDGCGVFYRRRPRVFDERDRASESGDWRRRRTGEETRRTVWMVLCARQGS
jgi:hypothetical protein